MSNTMRKITFISLLLALSLFLTAYNEKYWHMFRSDVGRTAMLSGSGMIDIPAVKWKYYAGGSLSPQQLLVEDINNDGALEYILISGGKVLAKTDSDILVWDTAYLAASRLVAIRDIDQDGKKDIIVANSQGRIIILSAIDGSIEYINPETDFNWIGAVVVKDINKDGFEDIYVADQSCGSSVREPRAVYGGGIAYSFRKGFKNVERLFTLEHPTRDYYCGTNNYIADIDGDGSPEILAPGDQYLYAYSTEDGRLKYASPFLGAFPWGSSNIIARDVDNDGAEEVFLYAYGGSYYLRGSKRILALKVIEGFLTPIWQISPKESSFQRDKIDLMPEPLGDFDNDGKYEFITSIYDSDAGRWRSYILDAGYICTSVSKWDRFTNCFESRVEVDGFQFHGSAQILDDNKRQLLFYDYTTYRYGIYELEKSNGSPHLLIKSLFPSGPSYTVFYDVNRGAGENYATRLSVFDYGQDGKREIVMREGSSIGVYDISTSTAVRVGLIEGVSNLNWTFYRPVIFGKKEYFVGHLNNGTVAVYDSLLRPVNDLNSDGVFDLRSGGYVANMLISDLEEDGRPEVFTTRSNGMISVLDGTTTDLVNPPRILWSRSGSLPVIGDMDVDGSSDLIFGEFEGNNLVINVYNSNLSKRIYTAIIAPQNETAGFYREPIFGDASGDKYPDIYYVYLDPYNDLAKYGIVSWDGASTTAQKRWRNEYGLPYQGDGQGWRTVVDSNGDGLEDYVINPYREIRILDATDGSVIARQGMANSYAGIISFFGGMLINHGGSTDVRYSSPAAFNTTDLSKIWESPIKWEYYGKYGSMVETALSRLRFMQTAVDSAHVYIYEISDGTLLYDKVLACGRIFETESEAINNGCELSDLTSSIAIKDLDGTGRSAFIVGSKDGYLYAVNAEDSALFWSLNFRYPIGDIIAGDLDGDGYVEVLISCGDGYIYAVDRAELKATDYVYENDGIFIATFNNGTDKCPADKDEDIDCQEFTNTLGANWDGVGDANGYEYAIVSQNGTYITYWTDNGAKTSVVTQDLRLVFDFMYYFLVRPYKIEKGVKLTGPETMSDGVKIVDITPPEINISLKNNPITPDGDGLYDYTDISIDIHDKTYITQWQMKILDRNDNVLFDTNPAFISVQNLSTVIRYDAIYNGRRLDGGEYVVRVLATDIGGHLSEGSEKLIVCKEYEMVREDGNVKRCVCPDRDNDGFADFRCGGDDCDDYNRKINPGAKEDCSTGDLNCDRKAVECLESQKCINGYCADPCRSGECRKGYICESGYCIPEDPCTDVICPDGSFCENGGCVDLCKNIVCPDESYCYRGKCYGYSDVVLDSDEVSDNEMQEDIRDVTSYDIYYDIKGVKDTDSTIDTIQTESSSSEGSGCSCSYIF